MAPPSAFYVLEADKAQRMKANTMVVPSPDDVARVINEIPAGETRNIAELRRQLADEAGADTACPSALNRYWKWIAAASQETDDACNAFAAAWWRVLKNGKLNDKLPGGMEAQRAKLLAEGVVIE